MGFFRMLFGADPQLEFYATRLSEQMYAIAKVGLKIESYFPRAYQICNNRDFINDAFDAFRSVGGQPGDAALEIYRNIDKDIREMQSFLHDWRDNPGIDHQIIAYAEDLYTQLSLLKEFISDTPPRHDGGMYRNSPTEKSKRVLKRPNIYIFIRARN